MTGIHTSVTHVSPILNRSSVLQHFKHEIRNKIMFDFYLGLPDMLVCNNVYNAGNKATWSIYEILTYNYRHRNMFILLIIRQCRQYNRYISVICTRERALTTTGLWWHHLIVKVVYTCEFYICYFILLLKTCFKKMWLRYELFSQMRQHVLWDKLHDWTPIYSMQ